ncbi:hypothetical protein GLOIN_2v1658696 [Rhizophagus irregularis DAOM 181602=DAOM 197198]|uniref:Uncharacterized protein n=1 Tax=Rhizophagus irregularis (strain DAOM 181602 / DAOM 197198 / MUCL 43194) TaxID=747089 RepID=A0A2P4PLL6_RHIID|nr:hypothetical protein GLOIN_2v1658696 [Rhizophagus irregularis DAOM 181602=DAOM 197198]POG66282.1 hypothetical protein GLOIN_2v1658696 [Rhizophagus irregularis DAOM 181602=DAOM 197198]|eukprot:XP_025173148.1 hypothetical protein GLOIN_2v1658696 [Rhizophagus irregularis DAOM 181602=DAOM 197198]
MRDTLVNKYGIIKRSILFNLSTTRFPDSFPIDIMHVFYENVAKYMLSHWMGTFYTNQTLNNEPYVLSKQVWTNIGKKWIRFVKLYQQH